MPDIALDGSEDLPNANYISPAPERIEVDKPVSITIKANRLTGGGVEQVSLANATVFSFYVNISGGHQEWKLDIPKSTDPSYNHSAVFTAAAQLSMEYGVKILPFSFCEKRK